MTKRINLGIYMNAKRGYEGSGALNMYAVRNIEQLLRLRSHTPLSNLNIDIRVSRDALAHRRMTHDGLDSSKENHWIGTREFSPSMIVGDVVSGAVGYRINDPYSRLLSSTALSDFIRHIQKRDASADTAVVLWGHADGPCGFLFSLTNAYEIIGREASKVDYHRDILSPMDVEIALKKNGCGSRKLQLICLDSCQSACLEFASVLAPYARYLISSQTYVPGSGWNYETWPLHLNNMLTDKWREAAINIAEDFAISQPVNTTISVIDLQEISSVLKALQVLTASFANEPALYSKLFAIRKKIETPDANHGGLVDLVTLFNAVAQEFQGCVIATQATYLVEATKRAVIKSVVSMDLPQKFNLSGCSIFFPTDKSKTMRYWDDIRRRVYFENDRQLQLFKKTGWHNLLKKMLDV